VKTTSKDEIIEEVRESIGRHVCSAQRFRQLKSALSKSSSPMVGDALLECWQTLTSPDEQFVEQEFVAGLLFVLNPATSLAIGQVLAGLRNWNLSVEEFPWYVALRFGEDELLQKLNTLEDESGGDPVLVRAAEAARYWLRADYAAEREQYTYRWCGH
jgi:hypothetical protein